MRAHRWLFWSKMKVVAGYSVASSCSVRISNSDSGRSSPALVLDFVTIRLPQFPSARSPFLYKIKISGYLNLLFNHWPLQSLSVKSEIVRRVRMLDAEVDDLHTQLMQSRRSREDLEKQHEADKLNYINAVDGLNDRLKKTQQDLFEVKEILPSELEAAKSQVAVKFTASFAFQEKDLVIMPALLSAGSATPEGRHFLNYEGDTYFNSRLLAMQHFLYWKA
ncbi:unnamed protein product [Cuscuta campestris]|uniref:Uncharacterized protein n=1 Tax=Cuscuta campestris TaxID=132261 RepID=A0A484M3M2_9ASTE|nr:unnamed protein product [Cuscuta campestris]